MSGDEPELDAEGRPRHDDPRDNAVPISSGSKPNWLPWLIGAVILVVLVVVLMGP